MFLPSLEYQTEHCTIYPDEGTTRTQTISAGNSAVRIAKAAPCEIRYMHMASRAVPVLQAAGYLPSLNQRPTKMTQQETC